MRCIMDLDHFRIGHMEHEPYMDLIFIVTYLSTWQVLQMPSEGNQELLRCLNVGMSRK